MFEAKKIHNETNFTSSLKVRVMLMLFQGPHFKNHGTTYSKGWRPFSVKAQMIYFRFCRPHRLCHSCGLTATYNKSIDGHGCVAIQCYSWTPTFKKKVRVTHDYMEI